MKAGLAMGLVIPDLWQQEAIRAWQEGKDMVVQAPTGSGKTYIFELLYPNLKTQAVFTVPTRAVTTGGTEPSRRYARSSAAPKLTRSTIMHHKLLTICEFLVPL